MLEFENSRIAIAVATIGVISTLGAALIANWDKLFPPSPKPQPSSESIADIHGIWHDRAYPTNGFEIGQFGKSFQFRGWGVLIDGTRFESSGNGTITGRSFTTTYQAKYQSGAPSVSVGNCKVAHARAAT